MKIVSGTSPNVVGGTTSERLYLRVDADDAELKNTSSAPQSVVPAPELLPSTASELAVDMT